MALRLTDDLLREARRRLGNLAAVFGGVLFLLGFVFPFVDFLVEGEWKGHGVGWAAVWLCVAASIAVVILSRRTRLAAETFLRIGLFYQVVFCYGLVMAESWGRSIGPEQRATLGLSWVSVCIVFFAIVVPASPRRVLLTSIASASAVPVILALSVRYSGAVYSLNVPALIVSRIALYGVIVALAYAGSRIVYRLRVEVGKAREMGSYRLTELLGRGGMGEVWKGQHRFLARPAAIKLIRADTGDAAADATIERFELEAQATASLESPHTVRLFDFGISSDRTFYYVMELLDGFDASFLVEKYGPVPAARAVHVLRQVCESLAEAHEKGLVHRDIKPANVYLCRYGRDVDFVKVLDFGLVRANRGLDLSGLTVTGEHVVRGTPGYMAPEQILGDHEPTARTDLYAVGCLAYWLITGQPVFEAETPLKMLFHHANETPVAPSRRSEMEIPPALDEIVLACLSKDARLRPDSAEALADALTRCVDEEPWTRERAHRWWASHRPDSGLGEG